MKFAKNQNKTKALISLAVYQLMLRKIDYDDITVKDICKTSGVSRMSFYRYYSKKDDIFIDYCDERFAEFYENFVKLENKTAQKFILGMFDYFEKNARQLLILKKAKKETLLMQQFDSYSRYCIASWAPIRQEAYYSSVVPSFLSGGFFNVLMAWVNEGMKESKEEVAEKLFRLFPAFKDKEEFKSALK